MISALILSLFAIELSPCETVICEMEKPTEKLVKVQLRQSPKQSSKRIMKFLVTGTSSRERITVEGKKF